MIKHDEIRMLGIISLLFASALLILTILNVRSWLFYNGPRWWPPLLLGALYWGVLGFGVICCRKWAVGLFAASTAAIGLCLTIGPIIGEQGAGPLGH